MTSQVVYTMFNFCDSRIFRIILVIGLWLFVWQLLSVLLKFPSPIEVIPLISDPNTFRVGAIKDKYTNAGPWVVFIHISYSLMRILGGVFVAFALALPMGLFVARFKRVQLFMIPFVRFMASASPAAWVPIVIITVGIGNLTAGGLVFLSVFFLLTFATVNSVEQVDRKLKDLAKSLGASKQQIICHVIVPAIIPNLFVILRINFFAAWMVILVAEGAGINVGLGAMIHVARESNNYPLQVLVMLLIATVGFLTDTFLGIIQHKLLWWHTGTTIGKQYV